VTDIDRFMTTETSTAVLVEPYPVTTTVQLCAYITPTSWSRSPAAAEIPRDAFGGPRRAPHSAQGQRALQKDAEILVQEDVGVEEDGALWRSPTAPFTRGSHVFTAPGQELVIRFPGASRYTRKAVLAFTSTLGQRSRHKFPISGGVRDGGSSPHRHARVQARHPHLQVAPVVLDQGEVLPALSPRVRFADAARSSPGMKYSTVS